MKLVDGRSKIGRKLEEWLPHDEELEPAIPEHEKKKLKADNQRRNQLPSIDEPMTKLEQKVKKWFTDEEKQDRPLIIKENVGAPVKILVITYQRAIWFEAGLFCRLKDVSDKVWRQFVSVHLTENIFSSSLTLRFFPYNDPAPYYNSSNENNPLERWHFNRLNKEDARRIYAFLKDKELFWQEKRRLEQVALRKPFPGRPPGGGGAPAPKKS